MTESTLAVTVGTDRPRYAPGEPITITLTVSNRGDQPARLHFSSGQRYDFTIEDREGKVLWHWAADRLFVQMLGEETLAPGAALVYRERFAGLLTPGTYRATGTLLAAGALVSASAPVTVSL